MWERRSSCRVYVGKVKGNDILEKLVVHGKIIS